MSAAGATSAISSLLLPTKLLVPPPTTWEALYSAFRGVLATAIDAPSRHAFESYTQKGIIQDNVLQNSPHGSILIFSLFEQLQHNPMFQPDYAEQKKRLAEESDESGAGLIPAAQKPNDETFALDFCQAMGPALTNFHDLLYQLQQQQEDEQFQNDKDKETALSDADLLLKVHNAMAMATQDGKDLDRSVESVLGPNLWKQQATNDPESVAAAFANMVTPEYFNNLFYSSKLALWTRQQFNLLTQQSPLLMQSMDSDSVAAMSTTQQIYEVGSAEIGQVALLRARAVELDTVTHHQYREFDASQDPNFESKPVGAQMDILFEVTSRYTETFRVPTSKATEKEESESSSEEWSSVQMGPHEIRTEQVEYTRLGVAVLEGYLHNNPNSKTEGLRWRVPLIREPLEFDVMMGESSVVRNVLSSSTSKEGENDNVPPTNTEK